MKQQRRGRAIAMSPDEVSAFLTMQRTCRIGTYAADTGPHVSPLWFVWDGRAIWLHSLVRSQRFTHVMRDPRISVLVDDGYGFHELRGVEISGTAEVIGEVPRAGIPDGNLAAPERLFASKYSDGTMHYDGKHAWLRVTPEKIVSWDFRKSGFPVSSTGVPLPQQVCEKFVELVNAGDFDAIADMFAEDAVLSPPPAVAPPARGREAIRATYHASIATMKPTITSATFIPAGNRCAMLISGTSENGPQPAMDVVDIVTLDDAGQIASVVVYAR